MNDYSRTELSPHLATRALACLFAIPGVICPFNGASASPSVLVVGVGIHPPPCSPACKKPLLPESAPWDPNKIRPLSALRKFLVANRLHGGSRTMNVVSSMMLKAMGKGDL